MTTNIIFTKRHQLIITTNAKGEEVSVTLEPC